MSNTPISLALDRLLSNHDPEINTLVTPSGLRSREASELRAELSSVLDDYGITRVAHLTGFDRLGIPVHMAIKPQGRTLASGSGKGISTDASWVSAVMECCEQSIWENLAVATVHASQRDMRRRGFDTVDGSACAQQKGSLWSPDIPVNWTPAWEIVTDREVWVPEDLVIVPPRDESTYRPFISGSNGLASGAHVLEAVLSGLMEVIERDGMTLATHASRRPHLDAHARLHQAAPSLADSIDAAGLRLEVVDATTEIGIPVVVAYVHDIPGGRIGSFKGAGAALSASAALVRAVTEAVQARCLIVSGSRDDLFESQRTAATSGNAQYTTTIQGHFTNSTDLGTGSVIGDLECAASRLVDADFDQILVIRHTPPGDPVQVVRVIVPGLEGYPFAHGAFGRRAATWVDPYSSESA